MAKLLLPGVQLLQPLISLHWISLVLMYYARHTLKVALKRKSTE